MNSISLSLSIVLLLNVAIINCDGLSLFQHQQQQLRHQLRQHDQQLASPLSSTTARRYNTIGRFASRHPHQLQTKCQHRHPGHVVVSYGTIRLQLQLQASPTLSGDGFGGGGSQPSQAQVDNATTLPQLMKSLWALISYASKNMYRGDSATILYPQMSSTKLSNPKFLSTLMAHFDACKDVCDNFGVNTVLVPYVAAEQGGGGGSGGGDNDNMVQGFTVKSYRNPHGTAGTFMQETGSDMKFAPDPFWDEDEEWDFSGMEDDDDDDNDNTLASNRGKESELPLESTTTTPLIPEDDDVIIQLSKQWVDKMMADLALCPFTQSSTKSGIPLGPVRYHIDRVSTFEDAYMAYWAEVCQIENVDENEISTTLHILPQFCMNTVELFEQWADTLTGTLETLDVENLLQLIFFHPNWMFRDGGRDRSTDDGGGMAAHYARRSPWPMVNILRTKQVRVAQRGIPTGLVYQQNEKTLSRIGTDKLERMLRLRDWSEVAGMKVDRKDMEALRVANDLQVHGAVKEEDTTFVFDSTPAANKVDRSRIDGGDMVNVILQALELRLGKRDNAGAGSPLNGAQTSAAMMASDFLLEELDRVAAEYPNDERAPVLDVRDDISQSRPSSAMASGGYAAAYGFDANDYDGDEDSDVAIGNLQFGSGRELEDAEMSALFGIGGIRMGSED